MTTVADNYARRERAEAQGWIFEDAGFTPGVPWFIGVKRPNGEIAGVIPNNLSRREELADDDAAKMDQIGVPK